MSFRYCVCFHGLNKHSLQSPVFVFGLSFINDDRKERKALEMIANIYLFNVNKLVFKDDVRCHYRAEIIDSPEIFTARRLFFKF